MDKDLWTIKEIADVLQIDEDFILTMERETIICASHNERAEEKLLPASEVEKLRIAKILIEDMEVNLPGVEVILQMRQNMVEMRCQFDEILKDLVREFRDYLNQRKAEQGE